MNKLTCTKKVSIDHLTNHKLALNTAKNKCAWPNCGTCEHWVPKEKRLQCLLYDALKGKSIFAAYHFAGIKSVQLVKDTIEVMDADNKVFRITIQEV